MADPSGLQIPGNNRDVHPSRVGPGRRQRESIPERSELTICPSARPVDGFWYLATISFQAAMSVWGVAWDGIDSVVIAVKTFKHGL
jgi:hypothetical protein